MKEQDIPAIMEAAAEPATADIPAGVDMEIQEEDTDGDGGGLEVSDIIPAEDHSRGRRPSSRTQPYRTNRRIRRVLLNQTECLRILAAEFS